MPDAPINGIATAGTSLDPILRIEDLHTHFLQDEGPVRAVDGVTFHVPRGRTVCVVGESGCGKSVTARSVLGIVDAPGRVIGGRIRWLPDTTPSVAPSRRRARHRRTERPEEVDLAALDPGSEAFRRIRGNEIAMVFQEPMASLSPMYTVANQLVETIRLHLPVTKQEAYERGERLLARVGIPRPAQTMQSYPFQLSGGMCQRVMIAIALSCDPSLLIADEPTTALDVTTQARIIDLLTEIQESTGMSMLFITHDLGVVAEVADEVVVMYLGTVVEQGAVDAIFHDPQHPYTKALLESMPRMGRGVRQRLESISGQVPHPMNRPKGCPFHPRCPQRVSGVCDRIDPPTVRLGPYRRVRCVLHDPQLSSGSR